ncbi:response regulator [Geomonas sp.]|uniref:response regulator n=1 Tax=Geomonas sp. TaxID=2651584 RepID=UPI002B4893BA|nr:response regulator [Geomonas sp.]HJV36095.1 response regulator [Geomonas sp.]
MLIICPNCKKRFEVDPSKLGEALKLRCSSCRAVFKLVKKSAPAPTPAPEPPQAAPPRPEAPVSPAVEVPVQAPPPQPSAQAAPGAGRRLKVVVANESAPFCEAVRKVLAEEPFEVESCNDGKVALETVERIIPDVLLLDVALPTMFGFEVCERVRQNPALAKVKIVLIASIYDKTRYKRSPNSLYGADDYIEKHHIPDSLVPMVYRLASGTLPAAPMPTESDLAEQEETRSRLRQAEVRETTEESSSPATVAAAHAEPPQEFVNLNQSRTQVQAASPAAPALAPAAEPDPFESAAFDEPAPAAAEPFAGLSASSDSVAFQEVDPFAELARELAAPPAPPAPPQLSEAEVKAKRLARIIVSDIVLYNQAKVEQGVRENTFYELLADDIKEGERLYRQRVSEQVRASTSFLKDAFEDLIAKKRAELRI